MAEPKREFELKLELSASELNGLARNPKLQSNRPPACKELRSIYFDTPDFRLHDAGVSFRVRSDGATFVQTVKLDRSLKNGLSNPIEIEDRLDQPEPDPKRIHDKRIRKKVRKAVEGSALTKAFETSVTRTIHSLRTRGSLIEVALDRGEALAMNRRCAICEAELELIKGNPKDLLQFAQALFAKGNVRLSPQSKAEKGYRLLLRKRPAAKIKPLKAVQPSIAKGQACGSAFAAILTSAREQIVMNRIVVLETENPEGAHQLRVGLTRLRSAQRALRFLIDSAQLRQIETDAQILSRAAGRLRDADVLIGDIHGPVAANSPDKSDFDKLYLGLKVHREAMREQARQALSSAAWSRLLLSLTLWPIMLTRDQSLQEPIEKFADKALQKRWKKARRLGRSIAGLTGNKRHEMRKSLKKLRYLVEFLAPLYPKPKVKDFVTQLKGLQDIFGYVNDVTMAEQLREISAKYASSEQALFAAGSVLGYHGVKAEEAWNRAPKAWRRLERNGTFWS